MNGYDAELAGLPDLYRRAKGVPVEDATRLLRERPGPLLVVGSGGSHSVARLVADLVMSTTGTVARAVTPLGLVRTPRPIRGTRVVLVSARGANPDVLAAWERVADDELEGLLVLCGDAGSPLATRADRHRSATLLPFPRAAAEEGFVACGSILSPAVVAARSLGAVFPRDLDGLWPSEGMDERTAPLWERPSLIALHGPGTAAAAVDLESKFAEGALGPLSRSDHREFAHGRYLELERRLDETAVLVLEGDGDERVAAATVELLPPDAPVVRLRVDHEPRVAAVGALLAALYVAGSATRARGTDLAAGGRERFGPSLYELDVLGS